MASSSVRIVFIPADNGADMQEIVVPIEPNKEIECLTDYAKRHFQLQNIAAKPEIFEQQIQQHMQQAQAAGGTAVVAAGSGNASSAVSTAMDPSMVSALATMQLVDVVALIPNTKENDYIAVNMYVDDKGIAKNLPVNDRATEMARVCGTPTVVRGDVFIGRYFDDEQDFRRIDFSLEECSSQAPWVQQASKWNTRKRVATGPPKTQCELLGCYEMGSMKCGRCRKVAYCSKKCQLEDWKRHKVGCVPHAAPAPKPAAQPAVEEKNSAPLEM